MINLRVLLVIWSKLEKNWRTKPRI
jgi:hypothetical protein